MWIYTPKKVQNLAHFTAADPWHGDQPTSFDLDRCFDGGFVPDYAAFEDESLPQKFAIRSELEREHRVLPDSLVALWRGGKVPVERLPALLKGLEPNLKRSDYIRLLSMNRLQRGIRTYAAPSFGVFVLLIGTALLAEDLMMGAVTMSVLCVVNRCPHEDRAAAERAPQTPDGLGSEPVGGVILIAQARGLWQFVDN
jgi:hypothetical protein